MSNFKIGDGIELLRYNEAIAYGYVKKGPFRIEGVDHYQVQWTMKDPKYFGNWQKYFYNEIEIVADMSSKKYKYRQFDDPDMVTIS